MKKARLMPRHKSLRDPFIESRPRSPYPGEDAGRRKQPCQTPAPSSPGRITESRTQSLPRKRVREGVSTRANQRGTSLPATVGLSRSVEHVRSYPNRKSGKSEKFVTGLQFSDFRFQFQAARENGMSNHRKLAYVEFSTTAFGSELKTGSLKTIYGSSCPICGLLPVHSPGITLQNPR